VHCIYPKVKEVYEDTFGKKDAKTNFTIEAVKPLDNFQGKYVPTKFAKEVSIYEYVPGTTIDKLEKIDPKLAKALATQISDVETNANIAKGRYEAEPHPGNWQIDLENKRLVRLDHANFIELGEKDHNAIRNVFQVLVKPKLRADDIQKLQNELPNLFADPEMVRSAMKNSLLPALADKQFPAFTSPNERLVFIRRALEQEAEQQSGKFHTLRFTYPVQSSFAALQKASRFREFLSPLEVGRQFLHSLDVSKMALGMNFLGSLATGCNADYSKFKDAK
jgi:hypothetical protein